MKMLYIFPFLENSHSISKYGLESSGIQWTEWTGVDSSGLQWTPVDSSGLQWTALLRFG